MLYKGIIRVVIYTIAVESVDELTVFLLSCNCNLCIYTERKKKRIIQFDGPNNLHAATNTLQIYLKMRFYILLNKKQPYLRTSLITVANVDVRLTPPWAKSTLKSKENVWLLHEISPKYPKQIGIQIGKSLLNKNDTV